MKKELSLKQKQFCLEYLKDFNGTKAYQTVYKVTVKQAEANSSRLIRNDKVCVFLTNATQKQAEKAEISIEWVIKELKEIHRRCTEGRLEGKTAVRSLDMIGKYLGMWIDKTELTINIKEFKTIVIQIQTIISKHINDPVVKNRIAKDLQELGL